MSFKGFNYWSGFGSDYKTQYEPIFNEDIATRNVLFEKTYVPKLIITSTPASTFGFNFIQNLWMPTSTIYTPKIYPIGTIEDLSVNTGKALTSSAYGDLSWGDYPEETYWEKQQDLGNVSTRIVIFEKYNPKTCIDAEAELTALLSAEISREIDKEIVFGLIAELTGRNVLTRTVLIEKTTQFKTVLFPKINRLFS